MKAINKPTFTMLCGLPGSSKSTWAEANKEELNFTIHSSDAIREEFGDVNDQSKNDLVFNTLHRRIKEDLLNGKNVCYDATNLSRKRRMNFISNELKNIPCEKICVLFATPYEVCLKNNANRERKVPEEVIERMYKNFEVPCKQEGWDKIRIFWWDYRSEGLEFNFSNDLDAWREINHDNPHHALSIGDHMLEAYAYYIKNFHYVKRDMFIADAVLLHDCGKPDVKSYVNSKNEVTEVAHFYQHHSVGSYKSLFYMNDNRGYLDEGILYVALLIELHMRPFLAWNQSDKAKEKDRRLFGDEVIKDIEILHECDLAAH